MESRAPAVVAIVVTTAPGPGLETTLASLVAQDYSGLSLLVVANGDFDHVTARVAAVAPQAYVRHLDENRGYAVACNEASLMVEGAMFLLFCHDDVRLDPDAVTQMVASAYRANAGVVTPKYVDYDDPMVLLHVGQNCDRFGVIEERVEVGEIDHGQQDLERDVFVAPGGVTLVRRDLFETLRGYDPLILALGEDLDLCWRAQVAGARIVVAPGARVAHRESIARGERPVTAQGVRRASLKDLQRRHQLLVVATGWGRRYTLSTLSALVGLEIVEFFVALLGRDTDRAGAIVGSWRWIVANRGRIRQRRSERVATRVLTDEDLRRLQVGGASRLKRFVVTLVRHGLDRARGILPGEASSIGDEADQGVGFGAAFSESEEFDDLETPPEPERHPSRILTSFRTQALVLIVLAVIWGLGSRNLVAMRLPLIGRLTPLDSWWTTWRHFFASWSSTGVGTGSPGMPGYAVLGFAGTFVFGRMGVLPRLALILAVPIGALGVARLLRDRVSNRARVLAVLAYLGGSVGMNMISQGRIDVLACVAGLPFLVRRLFDLLGVPTFRRRRDFGAPVGFGRAGWRNSLAGQRAVAALLTALLTALAPATVVAVVLVVLGAGLVGRNGARRPGRTLASLLVTVALLLAPMTVDTLLAGRRALEVFGLARGAWSGPDVWALVRGADGPFGMAWWGWLLPVAALIALTLTRGERRALAGRFAAVGALSLIVATLSVRHWMGPFSPDVDVLLALYGVTLAALVGLGVSAMEVDLRDVGFGWRQVGAGAMVALLVAAFVPYALSTASGRFDLPATSVSASVNALAPHGVTGYRVLWLGDPAVLPLAGFQVEPGLAAATSMGGLPGGATLFAAPGTGPTSVISQALNQALTSQTVQLGQLLASAAISSIVVMNSAAPELSGVQSAPTHPVPATLAPALARQNDLSLVLSTPSASIYTNAAFHGLLSEYRTPAPGATQTPTPVAVPTSLFGSLQLTGSSVVAAVAPASAFSLRAPGRSVTRAVANDWSPSFVVAGPTTTEGSLVMRRFPWNGILGTLTLLVWVLIWMGFGWFERVGWLVRLRPQRAAAPRHARRADD